MASARRDGPQRPSELPAEYRSGSFFSEAQLAPAGPTLLPPRRRGPGLRFLLTASLLLCGLLPAALILAALLPLHRADLQRRAAHTASLLREELSLLNAPGAAVIRCAVPPARLQALQRACGLPLSLYNLDQPVATTLPKAPALPWRAMLRALEGDRLPHVFALEHDHVTYVAAAVKLTSPPDCGSPVLLVLIPRWDPALLRALWLLGLSIFILIVPMALLIPRHLSSLLRRLHRRAQALQRRHRDREPALLSAPHTGSGAGLLPGSRPPSTADLPTGEEPSRDLDEALLSRPDEIGDLSRAFSQVMDAMRDNEARLGARVRELTTLHAIGRAISSVLDLEEALNKIVSEVVGVFAARRGALVLISADGRCYLGAGVRIELAAAEAVSALAEVVIRRGGRIRCDSLSRDPELAAAARHGGLSGSLMAAPLDQQGRILGVLLVTRSRNRPGFTEADLQLLSTVADHASTAVSNARLYDEVQRSSEDLELRVKERTVDLLMANQELARVVENLHQAQAQLVLSERLAGLGQLVAGVAHEINSPASAIRGAADALQGNVGRMSERAHQLAELPLSLGARARFLALCDELLPPLHAVSHPGGVAGGPPRRISRTQRPIPLPAPAQVRRLQRQFATDLLERFGGPALADASRTPPQGLTGLLAPGPGGGVGESLLDVCRTLAQLGVADLSVIATLAGLCQEVAPTPAGRVTALSILVGYLEELTYLYRNADAIRAAIGQISRIVGALKSYSHLDQVRVELTDIHEGLETTLVILHSELKYGILLTRKYGTVPSIHAYVDELNQVWTNLLHNAVQALHSAPRSAGPTDKAERPKEIVIETGYSGEADEAWVAIEDSGPGIAPEILPRIFEPFFTTKLKGEGTGLGLGIVRQIVTKHGGRIDVASVPGKTRFTVWLPVNGPALKEAG